jgi:hypothetical protein
MNTYQKAIGSQSFVNRNRRINAMKNYKVRIQDTKGPVGLIEVPGVEVKIDVPGIKERFIVTRAIRYMTLADVTPTSHPEFGISKKFWSVTEYSTGMKMPGNEGDTRKAALESFLKAMNPKAWKTFRRIHKQALKQYGIANQ